MKNSDQNKSLKKDFYVVISDEKFDKKVNNLIDQNYIEQKRIFIIKRENTRHKNKRKRRKHQLFNDVFNNKRRILSFCT